MRDIVEHKNADFYTNSYQNHCKHAILPVLQQPCVRKNQVCTLFTTLTDECTSPASVQATTKTMNVHAFVVCILVCCLLPRVVVALECMCIWMLCECLCVRVGASIITCFEPHANNTDATTIRCHTKAHTCAHMPANSTARKRHPHQGENA